jgi:ubiquinone/menaquinone biosynthesis C-methylase UbiE
MEVDWRDLPAGRIPTTLAWTPDALNGLHGTNVLDLGCGPRLDFAAADGLDGVKVGVDSNSSVLARAEHQPLVCADNRALPFADHSFDLVLCKAVLTATVHEESCSLVLGEARRVLRPGGTLAVCDFLINEIDPYFTRRYSTGLTLGLPYGAFVATDSSGAALYTARHFAKEWVLRQVGELPELTLSSYGEAGGTTRTGRHIGVFTMLARRRCDPDAR